MGRVLGRKGEWFCVHNHRFQFVPFGRLSKDYSIGGREEGGKTNFGEGISKMRKEDVQHSHVFCVNEREFHETKDYFPSKD